MDARVLTALTMATVAGLSTGIGGLTVLFVRKQSTRFLSFALAFAAGIMLTVSLYEMLPNAHSFFSGSLAPLRAILYTALYLLVGLSFSALIDRLIPQEGFACARGDKRKGRLLGIGIFTALGILVHNLPEGMATFMTGYMDVRLGLSLMLAISLHNIPEGISIAIPIYYGTGSRARAFGASLCSGMAEPLGALLAFWFLQRFLTPFGLAVFYAVIAGIMLYISFGELLPASREYGHSRVSLCGVLTGIVFMVMGLEIV